MFGYHSDLHVDPNDQTIGAQSNVDELAAMLKLVGADFAQTDGKGHPGYTSFPSQTAGASVAPGIVHDPLVVWREATRKLGIPLHVAYSGIFDKAAGGKHPDWCIRNKDGQVVSSSGWFGPAGSGDKMCPRSPYVDELMIPQLCELIDRYEIDGFWIDGDLWAMEACYCGRCKQAFEEKTGMAEPPVDNSDPNWPAWWNFTRESFEAYVTRYCDAVHRHKPGIRIASNWFQGFRCPGEPVIPTDWISGDALGTGRGSMEGVDTPRIEPRFLANRGKPWDLMLWCFYGALRDTSTMKPVEVLQQQAATIVACGGNLQTCENPFIGLRTGQFAEWRIRHLGKLAAFAKERQALCQGAQGVPQVAVLHSEHHFRAIQKGNDLFFTVDMAAARGASLSLIESQYGVDILDEWAMRPRLSEFPVVVAPEQDEMSEEMVPALKAYVYNGGKLLVSGAKAWERFGGEFLGVGEGKVVTDAISNVPAREESVLIKSARWRLVDAVAGQTIGRLGETPLLAEHLLPNPAATLVPAGKGMVAYIPFDVFREYERTRYALLRAFIQDVLQALSGPMDIRVEGPGCLDVVLRQKENKLIIHLINQVDSTYHPIPQIGPVTIKIRTSKKPERIYRTFETGEINWKYAERGDLVVDLPSINIHAAVVIEK